MPTYTRVAQITGELQYEREWLYRRFTGDVAITTLVSNTGLACIEISAESYTDFGLGFEVGAHTRGGFHFRYTADINPSGIMSLFFLQSVEEANVTHGVNVDIDNELVYFMVDDVIAETLTFVNAGFAPDTWIRMGWNWKPGAWLNFYIGNTLVYSTSQDLAAATPTSVWFAGSAIGAGSLYFDDIWVDKCVDETRMSVPPWRIFLPIMPTGPGTFAEWTPSGAAANWQAVDEVVPDGDTTHNYTNLTAKRDTFEGSDVETPSTLDADDYWRYNALIVQAVARRENVAQQAHLKMAVYDGLTLATGTAKIGIGEEYGVFEHRFDTQPDDSPWNETDVNAMEVGYISDGSFL